MIRKYLSWTAGAFVIFYLLTEPARAADVVHGALGGLHSAGESLSTFINGLGG